MAKIIWTNIALDDQKKQNYLHMNKENAIEATKELPQDFELEKLFEKLIFIEKVERGLIQIEQGLTLQHDDVKAIIKQW